MIGSWLGDAGRDLLLAMRSVRRQPGFTLFVALTLGLGIGANSAMFSLLDRLLLSPPPHIDDPDRVIRLFVEQASRNGSRFAMATTSYATYADLAATARSFSGVAAEVTAEKIFGQDRDAYPVKVAQVSGGYFEVLGARPFLGRSIQTEEDQRPAGTPVAVLSYNFWRRQFASEQSAIGSRVALDGTQYTVIGVAPPGFNGSDIVPIDLWVPVNAGLTGQPPGWQDERELNLVSIVGRLAPGVSRAVAEEEATTIYRQGMESSWLADPTARVQAGSLNPGRGPQGTSRQGKITLWLSGVSLIVFLIAVSNVSNLLLLRTAQRRQEVAVRLAIGMDRWRLVRQCVTESLFLALLGGAVGLLVQRWGGDLIRAYLIPEMAPAEGFGGLRVLAVTALAVLGAGLFTGLLPALQTSSSSLSEAIKSGTAARSYRRSLLRSGLLFVQTALSVALLIGAGLFVRSLQSVRTQDFGFATERTLLARIQFLDGVPATTRDEVYRQLLERVRPLPGIEAAIPVDTLPFASTNSPALSVPGVDLSQFNQLPFLNAAAPEYFSVMGMTLRRGRGFTAADTRGSVPVVVVSETMARLFWPGQDPIGRCIRFGFTPNPEEVTSYVCREVVGVVNDARPRSIKPESQPVMQFYVPYEQVPPPPFPDTPTITGLLLKTNGEPERMAASVRQAMHSLIPDLPYVDVKPYQSLIDPQMRPWQLGATMFSAFGLLALVMAAIGLYGLLAYAVAQRTKEMGVRMALGAEPGDLIRLVVGEGLRGAALGILGGTIVALASGRWLEPLLFNIRPWDPMVFGGVALCLLLVATLASLLPAWRATRTNLLIALRSD